MEPRVSNLLPARIKSLILDMDGVIWKTDSPIGDLPAIFQHIQDRGLKVAFATNNGTLTSEQYVERLATFGVKVEPWQVVTSALGIAEMLAKKYPSGGQVFAIGGLGVMSALRERGFDLLSIQKARSAQAVVMSFDMQINFEKVSEAALLVGRGTPFYATNPDKTFPTPRGEIPGAGAWVSVIVTATGVEPIYAGKPSPFMMELARHRLGTSKEETLVVGDRLETDIAGGQAAGYPVALVLSGVSRLEQAMIWRPHIDIIAKDLSELVE
jgi:4-nitrophenyl phosphatase